MYKLQDFTLAEMLEKSAQMYGPLAALEMVGGQRFSYAEVAQGARKVAETLWGAGIKKGDKVALVSENSPWWGISYLGIISAGAVVVPILIDFTAEQMGNIILHSEALVAICSEKMAQKLRNLTLPVRLFDVVDSTERDPKTWERSKKSTLLQTNARPKIEGDDIAMIVYTSGTTGLSKGVMLSHKNILSNAIACKSIIVLHRTDRLLSILPLAHTYEFTIGFVIPFLAGSHIHYLDRPPSATVLLPALKAVRPTIMLSVPLVIEKIYRSSIKPTLDGMKLYSNPFFKPLLIRFAGIKLKKTFGGSLRFFGIGGAPLSADVEEFLLKAKFPYAIGYGLTETSPLLAGCPPYKTTLRSTGPALEGVLLRIADPKPETGEGEIQAKGDNVFKGYFKNPEKTAECFSEDGWFKTGDLGFIDNKSRVFVKGRIKTMILGASGENIYPEEVEAVINQSPYVSESLVVEGEGGLTAFVYLKSEVLENIESRIRDGIDAAGAFSDKMGNAIANAEKSVSASLGHALEGAEKSAARLLESIRKEANEKLSSFSKIRTIQLQKDPFEKTPTQKIKRFLYTKGSESKKPG
jgi:long-chain acyl-CoA synthetase